MKRGERTATRTRSMIKTALLELIHEKNYPAITVNEITERANVGRSTLYKHYGSKADVLLDFHTDMFEQLFPPASFSEAWFEQGPPSQWLSFFQMYQKLGRNPFLLSYKLGNDLDYLISGITGQLTKIISQRLETSLAGKDFSIPVAVISQAVSSSFSGLVMTWFLRFQKTDPHQFAYYIHQSLKALVKEALKK